MLEQCGKLRIGDEMAFRRFSVGQAKGLQRAAYDGLHNFVVIAGPSGAGKSTLSEKVMHIQVQLDLELHAPLV